MADAPDEPVYLLTGSDRPKIATALGRLRSHFAPEAIETVSALEASGEAAVALCNAGSLFGDARLVIVEKVDGERSGDNRRKGGWKAADVDAMVAYLASPAPGTVLALVGEDMKQTTALRKACAKAGRVLEFEVEKKRLLAWVSERFRERGVPAEPEACAALVHVVGESPDALAVEIDKIATWAAGEPIGESEVLTLAAPFGDEPVFVLTDAWAARDAARALEASETIFERDPKTRRDVAPRLAGALGVHATRLRSVKRLALRGVRSKEAAAELRLNPFYAGKLFGQAEGFSPEELRDALVRLGELDGALKGQSKLAPDLELQRALVALSGRPAPARRTDGGG